MGVYYPTYLSLKTEAFFNRRKEVKVVAKVSAKVIPVQCLHLPGL